jgi:sterol 24-C-methyltransferase
LIICNATFTGATAVVAIGVLNKAAGVDPIGRTLELFGRFQVHEKNRDLKVDNVIDTYNNLHDANLEDRNTAYKTLVTAYYELSTLFYEWGWGSSFHFAYFLKGETFQQAIQRHEYYIAGRLGVSAGEKVLDCGCGIGGPMRNIARFTNAEITGVTLSGVSDEYFVFYFYNI